jgi:hypothetical protein
MTFSSVFSTFAVASALMVSPVLAASPLVDGRLADDRSPGTSNETLRRPDASGGPAAAIADPEGATIKGKIASVERESGRFVLDTDEGPISFITSPAELTGVEVGDVVQVSLVSDDD